MPATRTHSLRAQSRPDPVATELPICSLSQPLSSAVQRIHQLHLKHSTWEQGKPQHSLFSSKGAAHLLDRKVSLQGPSSWAVEAFHGSSCAVLNGWTHGTPALSKAFDTRDASKESVFDLYIITSWAFINIKVNKKENPERYHHLHTEELYLWYKYHQQIQDSVSA